MPRPSKQGLDYFSHDTDAVNDEKIETLRYLYGNDGYAFYFILLERIYRQSDLQLKVSDAETRQILARKIMVSEEKFSKMLQTALKCDCFKKNIYEKEGILTSNGISKRAQFVLNKRLKMKELYESKKVSDAETRQKRARNAPESTPSKVKKSKVKNKTYAQSFETFWSQYPRKKDKKKAQLVWINKIKPDSEKVKLIMAGLKNAINSKEWQKEGGQFIPYPTTFLNGERWNDEYETKETRYDEQGH